MEGSGRKKSDKFMTALFWFATLVAIIGECSPETRDVHLPPAFRKDYWNEYCTEHPKEFLSQAAFYDLWRTHFPYMKVRDDISSESLRFQSISASVNVASVVSSKKNSMQQETQRYESSSFRLLGS